MYWTRLCSLKEDTWAKQALLECMSANSPHSGAWNSKYRQEIQAMYVECDIGFILKDGRSPKANVEIAVNYFTQQKMSSCIAAQREHSLKYFPEYPDNMGKQKYINFSESSSILSKFRMGHANLGNRDSPAILICPSLQTMKGT